MNQRKKFNAWLTSLVCTGLIKTTSIVKTSFIIGSIGAFFSFAPIFVPLSGMLAGMQGSFLFFMMSILMRYFLTNSWWSLHILAYHVPGLFASLYWASKHWAIRLLPSILCMVLFIIHPIGFQALPYALLWVIPISIFFLNKSNSFLYALASTFTAHAIGSVIWLYTVPMRAESWILMIPLVLFERVVFAVGMLCAYHIILYVHSKIISYKKISVIASYISK